MKTIISAFLALFIFSSCSHKLYDSLTWQNEKVTIDSKIPDWPEPLQHFDTKSKINYTIANDRQNLYLFMKVFDEASQIKILRGGMEFKIDTSGKKLYPIAFVFPIANQQTRNQHSRSEGQTVRGSGEKPNHYSMLQRLLSQVKVIHLVGFKPSLGEFLSLFNTSTGISAAISLDTLGVMYYEAVIPFSSFYKNELTASDTNKVFSYEIKVNALPEPQAQQGEGGGGHRGGGGMGGGMGGMGGGIGGGMGGGGMRGGGMGGGGMHGGGGGGNSSGNNELYSKNQIKVKMRFSFR